MSMHAEILILQFWLRNLTNIHFWIGLSVKICMKMCMHMYGVGILDILHQVSAIQGTEAVH